MLLNKLRSFNQPSRLSNQGNLIYLSHHSQLSELHHLNHLRHPTSRLMTMCRMRPSKKKLLRKKSCRTESLRPQALLCLNPVPQKQGVHRRAALSVKRLANSPLSLQAKRLANLWTRGLCHDRMLLNKLRSFNQPSHLSRLSSLSNQGNLRNQGHPSYLIYLSHHSQLSELHHPSHSSYPTSRLMKMCRTRPSKKKLLRKKRCRTERLRP